MLQLYMYSCCQNRETTVQALLFAIAGFLLCNQKRFPSDLYLAYLVQNVGYFVPDTIDLL